MTKDRNVQKEAEYHARTDRIRKQMRQRKLEGLLLMEPQRGAWSSLATDSIFRHYPFASGCIGLEM